MPARFPARYRVPQVRCLNLGLGVASLFGAPRALRTRGSVKSFSRLNPSSRAKRGICVRCSRPSSNWSFEFPCAKLFCAVSQTAGAWNFGLRATRSREPRQARKGATVPGKPSVPRSLRSSSFRFYIRDPISDIPKYSYHFLHLDFRAFDFFQPTAENALHT